MYYNSSVRSWRLGRLEEMLRVVILHHIEAAACHPRLAIGPCGSRGATSARDARRVVDRFFGASPQLCSMTVLSIWGIIGATVHAWAVPDRCGPAELLPWCLVAVTNTFTTAAAHIRRSQFT